MPESSSVDKPLLLKGGTIVNHDVTFKADVLIHDGIIQAIGEELSCPSDTRVVDVSHKLLLPGGVDLDCHIGVADSFDPVADNYVSAGKAALLGGTTTIVNTINAHPDRSLISTIHSEAALRCFIEQRRMCRGLLYGQTSVSAIAAPLVAINSNDCANGVFTSSKDWATAASYVNCPPLRPDVQLSQKLLTHLISEDLVSVGSGHRAITTAVRATFGLKNPLKIPHGIAALGCRMIVLWRHGVESGSLDPCTFVKVTSTNPARLMNLYPQKGRIAVGSDADIIIWSNSFKQENFKNIFPNDVPNIFTVTTSSYQSGPEMVLLRGRIVVENNELLDDACCGVLLTSQPFSQYVYGRVNAVEKNVNSEYTPLSREPYMGNVANDAPVDNSDHSKEGYYFRKEYFDNMPKEALPPGQRKIHTSVKTAQPPGGSSNAFWMNE
uniref:dihydropyrimidinase n=1 Tax=Trichobilharzia regenti TaxID=157069 RepID=A0AA85KFD8_TRIRE|nr:unnamed protein product [Trichobilharzia regenti]